MTVKSQFASRAVIAVTAFVFTTFLPHGGLTAQDPVGSTSETAGLFGQFAEYRRRGDVARAQSDLRNAAVAEEAYFVDHETYVSCKNGDCAAKLPGLRLSNGVELEMIRVAEAGKGEFFVGRAWSTDAPETVLYWDGESGQVLKEPTPALHARFNSTGQTEPQRAVTQPVAANNVEKVKSRRELFVESAQSTLRRGALAEEAYFTDNEAYLSCRNDDCARKLPGLSVQRDTQVEFVAISAQRFVGRSWSVHVPESVAYWDSLDGGLLASPDPSLAKLFEAQRHDPSEPAISDDSDTQLTAPVAEQPARNVEIEARPVTLCASDETAVFHCTLGKKQVSLCASRTSRVPAVRYRFGMREKLEMELTADARYAASTPFAGSMLAANGSSSWFMRFVKAPFSYVVYHADVPSPLSEDGTRSWETKAGVVVERDGRRLTNLTCDRDILAEVSPEMLYDTFKFPRNESLDGFDLP